MHPIFKLASHPDHNYFYILTSCNVQDPHDPTTWSFQSFVSEWTDQRKIPETSAERLADLKRLATTFCEPYRTAALSLPDDTYVYLDTIKHWEKPVPWDNHDGRITLAGDAAHPMSPYRGQGLNNGLQDAANYVEALKTVLQNHSSSSARAAALKEAIDAYDKEVLERGRTEIQISARQTRMSHHMNEFLQSPMGQFGTARMKEMQQS